MSHSVFTREKGALGKGEKLEWGKKHEMRGGGVREKETFSPSGKRIPLGQGQKTGGLGGEGEGVLRKEN